MIDTLPTRNIEPSSGQRAATNQAIMKLAQAATAALTIASRPPSTHRRSAG